jgi:hypothetical protein
MLDAELIDELDEASRNVADVTRVPAEDAEAYLRRLVETFIADPSSLHWWESLKHSATRVPYENNDGLATLRSLLADQADVRLVVTDEEEPPWPVYAGSGTQLIEMLRECRFCEYMVASRDMRWVVFDTHMNELVSVGLRL